MEADQKKQQELADAEIQKQNEILEQKQKEAEKAIKAAREKT